jgi:hypothetical protein
MAPRTSAEVSGMGHSMKRKEDPRFIRGQGRYVDDIELPGMLYMDIARSPFAHARIKAIRTERALKVPGVLAVITGETLAKYNLHWMPTLMSDTQMVLPTEKVMYQAQEVAAVIATDRYAAADGADAVEVDYDPLPVVVDPFKALAPDAPVLRTDKKDKKDNRIFHWEVGDRQATDARGHRHAKRHARIHDAADERRHARRGLDDVGDGAGQLAAQTESLDQPQRDDHDGCRDAPGGVVGHEADAERGGGRQKDGGEEHAAPAVPVAEAAEHEAADGPREIADGKRREGEHQRHERVAAREDGLPDLPREDAEDHEVVVLEGAAQAGKQHHAPAAARHFFLGFGGGGTWSSMWCCTYSASAICLSFVLLLCANCVRAAFTRDFVRSRVLSANPDISFSRSWLRHAGQAGSAFAAGSRRCSNR